MLKFVSLMIKSKQFLICFGVILLLFIPNFMLIDFDPFLSILLLILVFILSLAATAVLSAILSVTQATVGYARAKQLAKQFPQAAEIEKQRGHLAMIRLVFVVVTAALVYFAGIYIIQLGGIIAAAAALFYFVVIRRKEKALRESFKQLLVLDALAQVFENIEYDAHGHFPYKEIFDLNLIQGFDTMTGNDWIKAERKGIPFCRSDIHIQERRIAPGADGMTTTHYLTTFQGSVMRFEQQQDYPTRLVVISEGFPNIRSLSETFKKLTRMGSDSSVETELDAFNRLFDAYSPDQVAARMILTPQMIDGMLHLENYTKHQLAFLFEGKFLYLFIRTPGADSLELSISSYKSVKEQQKVVAEQINHLAGLIDNMYFKDAGTMVATENAAPESAQDGTPS